MTGKRIQTCLPWSIRYRDGSDHLARVATPEDAIGLACRLLAEGFEVTAIGCGLMEEFMNGAQVRRIHAQREQRLREREQQLAAPPAFLFRAAGMPARRAG